MKLNGKSKSEMKMNNRKKLTIATVINYTNAAIEKWYTEVLVDYGVVGGGESRYDDSKNLIVVDYTEDGVKKTWSLGFYPEYLENGIEWPFDCWSELV